MQTASIVMESVRRKTTRETVQQDSLWHSSRSDASKTKRVGQPVGNGVARLILYDRE